ncbi:PIF1-like helicase [Nitzschia inconspicua]|uniref:ATP-dependent DNA helicase n=1 Tax=Nitzschia inconspicua TaxID=303405 RepID=A0A9K3Q2A0_9STRA|nr:PIF1-like helicase [Nitzschia inconspicua]
MLQREEIDVEEEEEDDLINEAMDHFLVTGSLEGGYDNDFRDGRGRFQFQTILTRCYGSHECGTNLVICPNVGPGDRILVIEANEMMITEQHEITSIRNERDDRLNVRALNELAIKCVRRIFDKKGHVVDIQVNGTLKNDCDFADIYFCKDVDQKTSFQIIICGTGKSHVIKTVCRYAQKLCEELRVKFDKRSIVVTALTGAAAVSINGETTAKAFAFKREVRNELEEFKNAYLVIVDEVSFASVADLQLLDEKMKEILDRPVEPFGGVPIVFSGDFTQLSPVGGVPLYKCDDCVTWKQLINVFMELKVNHRFEKDPGWGKLLERFRDKGPTTDEVAVINSRVVGSHKGPLEKNIPPDAVYATKTNVDRMAINDAIFVNHLEKTHSTDANVQPLMHTLCIKGGNLRFHVRGTRKEYHAMEKKAQDIIYASVGEAHVQDKTKKYHDPLLKLYHGRPLCINQNEDVSGCIANGAMCEFRGVKLKPGVSITDFETILIDGYCVNCVCVMQIESMVVKMLDGTTGGDEEHLIELKPKTIYASARFPVPCVGPITKKSMRVSRTISFEQFPVNLNPNMTKGMSEEVKSFMKSLRDKKQCKTVHFHGEDL